jgi:uncharacterized LabA/DUF88 family protein
MGKVVGVTKAIAYVDGFNLYFGALRGTALKWLDVSKVCQLLFPGFTFIEYKYFTARISNRPDDPQQATRQEIYLRALQTIPNLKLYFGRFLASPVWMPRWPLTDPLQKVQVLKTEEKMFDVNIATQLLCDGFDGRFDCAVVISNDADLTMPLSVVRNKLKRQVAIVYPSPRLSKALGRNADHIRQVRSGLLAAAQSRARIPARHGFIEKPSAW